MWKCSICVAPSWDLVGNWSSKVDPHGLERSFAFISEQQQRSRCPQSICLCTEHLASIYHVLHYCSLCGKQYPLTVAMVFATPRCFMSSWTWHTHVSLLANYSPSLLHWSLLPSVLFYLFLCVMSLEEWVVNKSQSPCSHAECSPKRTLI